MNQPTPLPSFHYNWTGNDIKGLHALADTVYGYVRPSLDVVKKLDGSVNELVHAASWQGQTAEIFKKAWERDSEEAVVLTRLMERAGEIFDSLALRLAWIQNAWEKVDPDPQKAFEMGRESAEAQIAEAVNSAKRDLNSLSGGKLASTARRDIKDGTIPAAQQKVLENELRVSGGGPQQRPNSGKPGPSIDTRIFGSHTVKDATGGGTVGGIVGGVVGGVVGFLGGPFAEITIPAGIAAGGGIGGLIGGVGGGIWGLGEDTHIW